MKYISQRKSKRNPDAIFCWNCGQNWILSKEASKMLSLLPKSQLAALDKVADCCPNPNILHTNKNIDPESFVGVLQDCLRAISKRRTRMKSGCRWNFYSPAKKFNLASIKKVVNDILKDSIKDKI